MTGKEFVYRVYDADNNYIGIWGDDVINELTWSQRLNTPGTTTTVRLARSANTTTEQRDVLATEGGEDLLDEINDELIASYVTNNTVGEDTDVDLNYNIDIFVHYGDFENLLTESGEELLAEDGDELITAVGAPLGARIFSGFILDYEAVYSGREYVDVTIASHGFELSQEVIKSGSDTTVDFSSASPESILQSILDTNPGMISHSLASIGSTGLTINQTFRLNTKLEGIQSVFNQSDDGWFWYGNVADNTLYFQGKSATAEHVFVFGKHINEIAVKRSMENLRNTVYFVGGDTGGGSILYKKYTDAPSITAWRQGLQRITDRRFTLAPSAQRYADKILGRYAEPIYTTRVSIPSEVYDIETIQLGQVVGFQNFGNFVDDLLLQIVSLEYRPRMVTLELGDLLDRQQDIVGDIQEDIQAEQYQTIPDAPS